MFRPGLTNFNREMHLAKLIGLRLVLASFSDAKNAWVQAGADPEEVEQKLDLFKMFANRNLIQGQDKDVSRWVRKPFADFSAFVDAVEQRHQQKQFQKQQTQAATKAFENEHALVVVPHTHEASQKYGAGTKWCTTSTSPEHWDSYAKQGIKLYYVLPKDPAKEKTAVAVYPHDKGEKPTMEVLTAKDKLTSLRSIARHQIPPATFQNPIDWNHWLSQLKHTINPDGSVDVAESINLAGRSITQLPFRFRNVAGELDLNNTKITSLPEGLSVGGGLYLSRTKITSLPEGLSVGGELYLAGTKITSLPEGLSVGGGLYLFNTKITSLPEGLKVGGNLNLTNTEVTTIPKSATIGGKIFGLPPKRKGQQ